MVRKILGGAVLCAVSGLAFAEGYFGISYAQVDMDFVEPASLGINIGTQINDVAGFELRLGVPMTDDTFGGTTVDARYIGALARFGTHTENGGIYLVAGMMDLTAELSGPGGSGEISDNDLVYGFGAELGDDSGFAFEYLAGSGDLEDVNWLSLGFFSRFE